MESLSSHAGKLPKNFNIQTISDTEVRINNSDIKKEQKNHPVITIILVPNVDDVNALNNLPEEEKLKMKNRYKEIVEASDVVKDMYGVEKVLEVRYFPGEDNQILQKDLYYVSEFINSLKTNKVDVKIIAPFTSLYNKGQTSVAETFVFEDEKLRKHNFTKIANMLNTIKPQTYVDWITCQSAFFEDVLKEKIKKPNIEIKLYNGFLYNLVYYFRIKKDSAEWKIIENELKNVDKSNTSESFNKLYTLPELKKMGLNPEGLLQLKFKNIQELPKDVKLKNGKYMLQKNGNTELNLKFSLQEILDFVANRETRKSGSKDAGKFITAIIDHRKLVTVSEDIKKDQAIKFNITFDGHQIPLFAEEWEAYKVNPEFRIVHSVQNNLNATRSKSLEVGRKN